IVPTAIRFVDIAGLVRGASKGEGLGNKFLSHIREVDAIAHVVRCFEDENITHVDGRVDPVSDVKTIHTELVLTDVESVSRRLDKAHKQSKSGSATEKAAVVVCERLLAHLDTGAPARTCKLESEAEEEVIRDLHLLTSKPTFYVANVDEDSIGEVHKNAHYQALVKFAEAEGAQVVPICAALEEQISELDPADRPEFLESAGLEEA